MSIVDYNLNLSTLKIDDMVKITLSYENAYFSKEKIFEGKKRESFWTQIIELNPRNKSLLVMISNDCLFTSSSEQLPFKYGDFIEIHKRNIKEHKRYETLLEKENRKEQVSSLVSILESLPEDEKQKIFMMSDEEKLSYIDQTYLTISG
tara:strand:- start:173 stop:619 length:447 start_codon:yes stop_codon:yes gene_type:complete